MNSHDPARAAAPAEGIADSVDTAEAIAPGAAVPGDDVPGKVSSAYVSAGGGLVVLGVSLIAVLAGLDVDGQVLLAAGLGLAGATAVFGTLLRARRS